MACRALRWFFHDQLGRELFKMGLVLLVPLKNGVSNRRASHVREALLESLQTSPKREINTHMTARGDEETS